MTTTTYATQNMAGVDVNRTYTVPQTNYPEYAAPPFAVGTTATGTNGTKWVFCLASAAIALGDVVQITSAFAATGITTTNGLFGDQVGVAGAVAIASGDYGWIQIYGKCDAINVKASCLPNVQLATTATAGSIDDATATGGKKITNIIITATNTAATVAAKAGMLTGPVVSTAY